MWRDAKDPNPGWARSDPFATELGHVEAVSLCLSDARGYEGLEIAARVGGRLYHLSRRTSLANQADERVATHSPLIHDACGVPAIVQGVFGNRGNFELVTPRASGGLVHLWRDNDHPDASWKKVRDFGGPAEFDAVALIHGDLHDHLEAIARSGDRLAHFWRTNSPDSEWREAKMLSAEGEGALPAVAGVPAFIHKRRPGSRGSFDVVTPTEGGELFHLWRDNDEDSYVWRSTRVHRGPETEAAAVFEGERGADGNRDLLIFAHGGGRDVCLTWPPSSAPADAAQRGHARTATFPAITPSSVRLPTTAGEKPRQERAEAGGSSTTGRRSLMRAPPPGAAAAITVPSWASAAWRTIARPRPEPGVRRADGAR
jgi:hypothetical protein